MMLLLPLGRAACAALLFMAAPAAQAADFYVSTAGNDRNSGSLAAPWRSLAPVNSRAFAGGDRIFLQGGQSFPGPLLFDAGDRGTSAAPVTVTSYGTGRATLAAGTGRGIAAYNTGGIDLRNLIVRGEAGNTAIGILFYMELSGSVKLKRIYIDAVEVVGFGLEGISIGSWNGTSGFEDVRLSGLNLHGNLSGLNVYGFQSATVVGYAHRMLRISDSRFYDNLGKAGATNGSGSGLVIGNSDDVVVERCVAYNNGGRNDFESGPVGIWAYESNNVLFQFNESHHNRTARADGGGFDFDGGTTNSVMQFNYSHDNDGPGYLLCQFAAARAGGNNSVRYNISQNDGRRGTGGIHLYNAGTGIRDAKVYQNVVFMSPSAAATIPPVALKLQTGTVNTRILNNLFVATGGIALMDAVSGQTGALIQGNAYWSSGAAFIIRWSGAVYNSLAAWRTASGQEQRSGTPTGLTADPMLVSPGGAGTLNDPAKLTTLTAYQLKSVSPLINKGLDILALFGFSPGANDYFGTAVPQNGARDIGVHEFVGAPLFSACDVTRDGSINETDVLSAINQTLAITPCTTGDINRDSRCDVMDVQRAVNASLGVPCPP